MILKIGAIYSLRYQRWQTNFKVYAFILWPGGGATKTHLLNIGAIQLNVLDKAKIVRTITRLAKVPNASKYNGRLLYQIFKSYLPQQIKKCYRTYFTHYITHAALINFGLNKSEDFSEMELSGQSSELFEQAQKDYQVKAMSWHSDRGATMKQVEESFSSPPDNVSDKTTGGKPSVIKPATRPATRPAIKPKDDGDEFGY